VTPSSFTGLESCLKSCASNYRRSLWAAMPVYVEVWCEKDALAGVILEETKVYDVPLMVARGYSSLTFLHSAAKAIEARGKPFRCRCRSRHRGQAATLRTRRRNPFQAACRHPRAGRGMEPPNTAHQTKRHQSQEVRQCHLGRVGRDPRRQAPPACARVHRAPRRSGATENPQGRGRERARAAQEMGHRIWWRCVMSGAVTIVIGG